MTLVFSVPCRTSAACHPPLSPIPTPACHPRHPPQVAPQPQAPAVCGARGAQAHQQPQAVSGGVAPMLRAGVCPRVSRSSRPHGAASTALPLLLSTLLYPRRNGFVAPDCSALVARFSCNAVQPQHSGLPLPPVQHELQLPQRSHRRAAAAAAAACCWRRQVWEHSLALAPEPVSLDHSQVSLAGHLRRRGARWAAFHHATQPSTA